MIVTDPPSAVSDASNPAGNTYAAIDLGSNSFHLLITDVAGQTLAKEKQSVRLAAGLDSDGNIDWDTRGLAMETLKQFNAQLTTHRPVATKVVGTSTFRRIQEPGFIAQAEQALSSRIDIISGEREAEYIYQGVTQEWNSPHERLLVVDIGGGSTELAIGKGRRIFDVASVETGCVRASRTHMVDGYYDADRLDILFKRSLSLFNTYRERFDDSHRDVAIGTSGTIRAAYSAMEAMNLAQDRTFSLNDLETLAQRLLQYSHVDQIDLANVSERRRAVLPAGVSILRAVMQALDIQNINVATAALREGLLSELLPTNDQQSR